MRKKVWNSTLNWMNKNPILFGALTAEIRRIFEGNSDTLRRPDQIEASIHRVHSAVKDATVYQSSKVLDLLLQKEASYRRLLATALFRIGLPSHTDPMFEHAHFFP